MKKYPVYFNNEAFSVVIKKERKLEDARGHSYSVVCKVYLYKGMKKAFSKCCHYSSFPYIVDRGNNYYIEIVNQTFKEYGEVLQLEKSNIKKQASDIEVFQKWDGVLLEPKECVTEHTFKFAEPTYIDYFLSYRNRECFSDWYVANDDDYFKFMVCIVQGPVIVTKEIDRIKSYGKIDIEILKEAERKMEGMVFKDGDIVTMSVLMDNEHTFTVVVKVMEIRSSHFHIILELH